MQKELLRMENIVKTFPGVKALNNAPLHVLSEASGTSGEKAAMNGAQLLRARRMVYEGYRFNEKAGWALATSAPLDQAQPGQARCSHHLLNARNEIIRFTSQRTRKATRLSGYSISSAPSPTSHPHFTMKRMIEDYIHRFSDKEACPLKQTAGQQLRPLPRKSWHGKSSGSRNGTASRCSIRAHGSEFFLDIPFIASVDITHAVNDGFAPPAASAARIIAAPALRSVAETSAPLKCLMPWMVATLPLISTSAPSLRSSPMY